MADSSHRISSSEYREVLYLEKVAAEQALEQARATIARLEAERDALMREKRALANGAFSEMARVEKERDLMGASAARMREALESFPAAMAPVGDDGGWVYVTEWEAAAERFAEAASDPAPTAWLAARIEVAVEALEPYLRHRGLCDQGCVCGLLDALAGRAGTEGQP